MILKKIQKHISSESERLNRGSLKSRRMFLFSTACGKHITLYKKNEYTLKRHNKLEENPVGICLSFSHKNL